MNIAALRAQIAAQRLACQQSLGADAVTFVLDRKCEAARRLVAAMHARPTGRVQVATLARPTAIAVLDPLSGGRGAELLAASPTLAVVVVVENDHCSIHAWTGEERLEA